VFCSLEKGSKQFMNSSINKRKLIQQLSLLRRKEHGEIFIESRYSKFPMIVTVKSCFLPKKNTEGKTTVNTYKFSWRLGALCTHLGDHM